MCKFHFVFGEDEKKLSYLNVLFVFLFGMKGTLNRIKPILVLVASVCSAEKKKQVSFSVVVDSIFFFFLFGLQCATSAKWIENEYFAMLSIAFFFLMFRRTTKAQWWLWTGFVIIVCARASAINKCKYGVCWCEMYVRACMCERTTKSPERSESKGPVEPDVIIILFIRKKKNVYYYYFCVVFSLSLYRSSCWFLLPVYLLVCVYSLLFFILETTWKSFIYTCISIRLPFNVLFARSVWCIFYLVRT